MEFEEMIIAIVALLIVLIPVAGITLRFALKPVMESIARLLEARVGGQNLELLERRLALLEQEMTQVRRIAEGSAFDRALDAGSREPRSGSRPAP
ncbi:MAG: hypothetical protein P8177_08265 [Gemmatimonadota bacterium]|jgi:hypothetical protein